MTALIRLRGHLRAPPEVVVDADLHDVGPERDRRVGLLDRLFGGGAGGDVPREEEARLVDVGVRPLPVAHRHARGAVAAEAEHSGDAVARVEAELRLDVLLGVERSIRLEAAHVVHVPVRVDEARHDGPAADVDLLGVGRHLDRVGRPHRLDAAVAHHQHAVLDRVGARAVDDARAHERLQARRGLDLRLAAGGDGHDSQSQQDGKTLRVHCLLLPPSSSSRGRPSDGSGRRAAGRRRHSWSSRGRPSDGPGRRAAGRRRHSRTGPEPNCSSTSPNCSISWPYSAQSPSRCARSARR